MLRFAPSPTGDMHIGNLRVAIFNHIVATQRNEGLTVRIEDTDKERNIEGKDKEILDILGLFDIAYKDVTYQSKNLHFHQQFGVDLLRKKRAFNCFCSDETLNEKRELAKKKKRAYRYDGTCENLEPQDTIDNEQPFVVRLKKPLAAISFTDYIKGELTFEPNNIDSFIILRQDKNPTYNFACAVDDMLSDISIVIRGEDHLSNTPKQEAVRLAIGYDKTIEYAHLPIILNNMGKKMSKRDDASSVKWLLEQGFIPSAIANYLILIGNKVPKEIFTLEESIEWFDLKNISRAPARFDIDKLRFINNEHLRIMDETELSRYLGFADASVGYAAKIYLDEASTLSDLRPKIKAIFDKKNFDCEYGEGMKTLQKLILEAEHFEEFNDLKSYLMKESGLKGKNFFKPIRLLLTGAEHGPDVGQLYAHLKNYLKEIVQ